MKKIIITERQLKMLKESQQDTPYSLNDDFYDFEVELQDFGVPDGSLSIVLFKDKDGELDYDYDTATIFELDFEWESEPAEAETGYGGYFGWYPTELRMIQPEKKNIDLVYADIFIQDVNIKKAIDNEIDKGFDRLKRDPF